MTDHENLIDHALIDTATAKLETAAARLTQSASDAEAARKAHQTALTASERAVAGLGGDPMAAEMELEAAARAAAVSEKVHAAATKAHTAATAGLAESKARAWGPVYLEAIRHRIAAAAKADAARRTLAEAEADHGAATDLLKLAKAHGTPHAAHEVEIGRPVSNEATERLIWTNNGVDLERGTTPWLQQFEGK